MHATDIPQALLEIMDMLRILTKVILIAAVVLLAAAVGMPLVKSTGALDLAETALASDETLSSAGETLSSAGDGSASLMGIVGDIDSVDFGDEGLTLTTHGGEELAFDLDPTAIMEQASLPSGEAGADVLKYSLLLGIGTRILYLSRRLFRVFLAPFRWLLRALPGK